MSTPDAALIEVDEDSYEDLLANEPLVLLHVWADWCGPCNSAVEPVLADIARTYADSLVVAAIDAEANPNAIAAFDIETLLTTMLFEAGQEVARFQGKTPYAILERAIETHRS